MAVSVVHKVRGIWQGHEVALYIAFGAGLSTVVKGNWLSILFLGQSHRYTYLINVTHYCGRRRGGFFGSCARNLEMQLYADVLMHGYYSKIGAHKQTSFNKSDTGPHSYKA